MAITKLVILLTIAVFIPSLTAASDDEVLLFDKNFKTWQEGAENGIKRDQYRLGLAYLTGSGTKANVREAVKWLQKSADQGYIQAHYRLGLIYYQNKDSSGDYTVGFTWMKKAAQKDYGLAQYYLSRMYLEGRGVNADLEQAMVWAAKAKHNHIQESAKLIAAIEQAMRKPKTNIVIKSESTGKETPQSHVKPPVAYTFKFTDIAEIVQKNNWISGEKPVEYLPSKVTKCAQFEATIRCMSDRLRIKTKVFQADYKIEAMITDYTKPKNFNIRFKQKFLFVLPMDADNPNVSGSLPKLGDETELQTFHCKLENRKKIVCLNQSKETYVFTAIAK